MSWPTTQIASVARIVSGATPSTAKAEYWNGGICWATPKDISDLNGSKFLYDTPRKITEVGLRSCSAEILPPNSVLFSSRAPIGLVAINQVPTATNQGFKSFVPEPAKLDAGYLYHWLRTNRSQLERMGVGATFAEVSKAIVSRIEIPLPPLDEQRRIAAILDRAEELRAKRRAAIALLDQLPQAIFLETFGDPSTNPRGWPTKPLKDITTKIGSGSTPTGGESAYKSSGIALIRSMNIHDGLFLPKGLAYIDETQAAKLSNVTVAPDDVLLNITGASVARVAMIPSQVLPARVNQHVSILRCGQGLSPRFLESLLINPSTKKKLLRVAGAGATREAITKEQLEAFLIPVPPLDLQAQFAERIEAKQRAKAAHQSALAKLDDLLCSLQAQIFGGQNG